MRLTTIVIDLLVVLAFAVAGQSSHYGAVTVSGVLLTAWPFAVGALVGWILTGGAGWALRSLRAGLVIWPVTLLVGMGLRWLTGSGTAPTFVLVAAGVFGVGLLGWRAIAALAARRSPGPDDSSKTAGSRTAGSDTDSAGGTP